MEITQLRIIETAVALIIYVIIKLLLNRYVNNIVVGNVSTSKGSKIVKKAINLTLLSAFIIVLLSIWGVNQSELAVFVGSVLTVIGIALFAQWSILSNITSGIIIFFNHSVQLEDTILIIDKDYEIEGKIADIKLFFVVIETTNKELIYIPNSIFLNKMIKKKTNV